MCHRAVAVLLALWVWAGAGWAQTGEQTQPATGQGAEAAPVVPDLSDQAVTGEAVIDLADFVCGCLNDSGIVPDWAQVQTVGGRLERLSAAQVFALLARTAHLWMETGELPATVPLTPREVNPPQLDPEDLPEGEFNPEEGRNIPTEDFLSWCADTVYWVDRFRTVPTAVWLNGERLSAAEYLAGLAICLQYAYWEGELGDYIFLPRYLPPQTWVRSSRAALAEAAETGGQEAAETEGEAIAEAGTEESSQPLGAEPPVAAPASPPGPTLTILPSPGSRVSGVVEVSLIYTGPPLGYAVFRVDGRVREMTNREPLTFRWDTSSLTPGTHTLRVQIYGKDNSLLIDQASAYTVIAPAVAGGKGSK